MTYVQNPFDATTPPDIGFWRLLCHRWFGTDYVLFQPTNNLVQISRVLWLGGQPWVRWRLNGYRDWEMFKLYPQKWMSARMRDKIAQWWQPITPRMFDWYEGRILDWTVDKLDKSDKPAGKE